MENVSKNKLPEIKEKYNKQLPEKKKKNPFKINFEKHIEELNNKNKKTKKEKKKIWQQGPIFDYNTNIRNLRKEMKELRNKKLERNEKNINIIHTAHNVFKNKINQKENLKKFLLKKRDLFLMQIQIDQKKEKIRFFEEKVNEKASKLKSVEKTIKIDEKKFNKFLDDNKFQTRQRIKDAEKETKNKLEIINSLKSRKEKKTTKLTLNTKLLEKFENLFVYKNFLDFLTPETFKFSKIKMINLSKKNSFEIASSNLNQEINYRNSKNLNKNKTDKYLNTKLSNISELQIEKNKPLNKIEIERDENDLDLDNLHKYYNVRIFSKLIELLKDKEENFEMFFKQPNQLLVIYNKMEEENIELIRKTQILKNNYEICSENFLDSQKDFTKISKNFNENKKLKINQISQKKKESHKSLSFNKKNIKEVDNILNILTKKIKDICTTLETDNKENPINCLASIEKKIIDQIVQLNKYNYNLVKKCERNLIEKKKKKNLQILQEKEKILDENKKKKILEKNFKKNIFRKDQFRSYLKKKVSNVEQNGSFDQEEVEYLRYFT